MTAESSAAPLTQTATSVDRSSSIATGGLGAGTSLASRTVTFFGDSTALMLGIGMQQWASAADGRPIVGGDASLGCALVPSGERLLPELAGTGTLSAQPLPPGCPGPEEWASYVTDRKVDLAVVEFGLHDTADWRAGPQAPWRHLGDPEYDVRVRDAIERTLEAFESKGVPVAWLLAPRIALGRSLVPLPDWFNPDEDARRIDRLNELVREVAEAHTGVTVLDLASFLDGHYAGGQLDVRARPDGVHLTVESAGEVAQSWLGSALTSLLPPSPTHRHGAR